MPLAFPAGPNPLKTFWPRLHQKKFLVFNVLLGSCTYNQRDGIYRARIICRNLWSHISLPNFITCLRCRHSSVDSSAPSIMPPRVWPISFLKKKKKTLNLQRLEYKKQSEHAPVHDSHMHQVQKTNWFLLNLVNIS